MIRTLLHMGALIGFCGLTYTSEASAQSPPRRVKYVVAAMGDSLTDPKSQGGKYLEVLRARCPESRFDSYGKGGNMVNMMRKRFLKDVYGEDGGGARPEYTHVIVLGGIGDILSNLTAKRGIKGITGDLAAMYAMAHERRAKVVAMTLPPWGGFQDYDSARHQLTIAVNTWVRAQLAEKAVDHTLDLFPLLSCGAPNQLCKEYAFKDLLHWNKKGHEIVGDALHTSVFADCE